MKTWYDQPSYPTISTKLPSHPTISSSSFFPHLSFHFHLKKERWIFKWDEMRLRWEREGRWWDWLYYFSSIRWWLAGWLMIFFILFINLTIMSYHFLVFLLSLLILSLSSHYTTLSSRIHTLEKPIHQLRELVTSWDVIDSSSSSINPDDNNNIQIILEN